MNIRQHYNDHLGKYYSWIRGEFKSLKEEFLTNLTYFGLAAVQNKLAIDLGCGHGIQTIALAESGYSVIAIDFDKTLLDELKKGAYGQDVIIQHVDFMEIDLREMGMADLICCCGDTISHFENFDLLQKFLNKIYRESSENTKLILEFRDNNQIPNGRKDLIVLKSEPEKVAACFLAFEEDRIIVNDMFFMKSGDNWDLTSSTYVKSKLNLVLVKDMLEKSGFSVTSKKMGSGMNVLFSEKLPPIPNR